MNRYAVAGNPVRHSRSPWLHSYFARCTQRSIVYAAYQPAGAFADFAAGFFKNGGSGLNVTLPYKADALAFAGSASAFAKKTGAANVLKRLPDGRIHAYNTDGGGLLADLNRLCAGGAGGKKILLLGAGGAAAAAAHALAKTAQTLTIYNRTAARAQALADACGGCAAESPRRGADIVINATSAGHAQEDAVRYAADIFADAELAYDLSYGAAAQGFIQQAAAGGAKRATDGIGMLVWQAALSFALWEGVMPAPMPAIRRLQETR